MFKQKVFIARIAGALLASAAFMHDALPQQSTEGNKPESCLALADGEIREDFSATQVDLALENLADLKIKIESIKARGAQAEDALILSALNHEFSNKFQIIYQKLVSFKFVISKEEFLARLKAKIIQRFKVVSEATAEEASARAAEADALHFIEFAQKSRFYELQPGEFSIELPGNWPPKRDIKIEHPFAMMDTDLSQAMWVWLNILMGVTDPNSLNPSFNQSEEKNLETHQREKVGTNTVGLVPDLPVENVSNNEIERFLNGLNRLSMNDDENIHKQIRRAFPDHQRGTYYALPTLEQMIFVQSNRGANISKFFDSDVYDDVKNYAWTGVTGGLTRPVKSKQPRMINTGDGNQVPFFDLTGNVWKLTRSTHLEWNQHPLDAPIEGSWAVTGGSAGTSADLTRLGSSSSQDGWPKNLIGFRLVSYAAATRPAIHRQELIEAQEKARRAQELNTALTQVHSFKNLVEKSHKLDFVDIKPQNFVLRLKPRSSDSSGADQLDYPVKLRRDFAMATAPVTQMVWSKVQLALGVKDPKTINPAKHSQGRKSVLADENGIRFHIRPDNPIENISPKDVREWLEGLNRLSKNQALDVQEMLKELIPGHELGDVYDLPVIAQLGLVAQNRGKNNLKFFDRDDPSEYNQYSVCRTNAFAETLPVKSLKPRTIDTGDGKTAEFYDLIGNVQVLVKERISSDIPPTSWFVSDKDKEPIFDNGLTASGASYYSSDGMDSCGAYLDRYQTLNGAGSPTIGVRLVRYRDRSFWRKFFLM